MIKKVQPKLIKAHTYIEQFPHCDPRILHAPGECEFCDMHPEWQELRRVWAIAYTGYEPEGTELPDPATHARGFDNLNAWGGNQAKPACDTKHWETNVHPSDR